MERPDAIQAQRYRRSSKTPPMIGLGALCLALDVGFWTMFGRAFWGAIEVSWLSVINQVLDSPDVDPPTLAQLAEARVHIDNFEAACLVIGVVLAIGAILGMRGLRAWPQWLILVFGTLALPAIGLTFTMRPRFRSEVMLLPSATMEAALVTLGLATSAAAALLVFLAQRWGGPWARRVELYSR